MNDQRVPDAGVSNEVRDEEGRMDGLGGGTGGAPGWAPGKEGNENETRAPEPVQPAQPVEAAVPVVDAATPGIPIERVREVFEVDPGFLGDTPASSPTLPPRRKYE